MLMIYAGKTRISMNIILSFNIYEFTLYFLICTIFKIKENAIRNKTSKFLNFQIDIIYLIKISKI